MDSLEMIREKAAILKPLLNEKDLRLWSAAESKVLGHGGIELVSEASGLSRTTISNGLKELSDVLLISKERIRKPGGGRKKTVDKTPAISAALDKMIEPSLRGDPESPLLWTSKSLRKLSDELKAKGFDASHKLVGEILKANGFSLQANRKTDEGNGHPDRDAQFNFINDKVKRFQKECQPVISVDAKKKELVGNYKNNGREWHQAQSPLDVKVYDFLSDAIGKALPYGVYDLTQNTGWVSVGIDHDTAEFAVETIRKWWDKMGSQTYPKATKLLITADGGGSNGRSNRLWKKELKRMCNETGLEVEVCHFPPATSKWNKIEHRLFSYISKNWRGKPLESYEVIVNLIGATKTKQGLEVICELDTGRYNTGIKISDQELIDLQIEKENFHGEWNYKIKPNPKNI